MCRFSFCPLLAVTSLLSLVSFCESVRVNLANGVVTSVPATFYPSLPGDTSYFIEAGGMQIDVTDDKKMLIAVMPQVSLKRTAAISNLPVDDVTQPLTVLYGDPTKTFTDRYDPQEYIDGDNGTFAMIRIGHMYQTSNKKYIYFVDQRSCVRQLDRMAVNITTIIGKGHCGNSTLGFDSSTDPRDVYGMTYYEAADTFFISVQDEGVYTFSRTSPQLPYTQTGLLPLSEISTTISDGIGDMLTVGDIVWQKVGEGINRYEVSGYKTNKNTILDFSLSGNAQRYLRYPNRTAAVSTPEGAVLQHPLDPDWLCILDKKYASLFFYNLTGGTLIKMCSKSTTSQDGTADVCTLEDLTAGVWVSETLMIVYETNTTMKKITWAGVSTTTPTTTPTKPPKGKLTTGEVVGIVISLCILVTALIVIIYFICHPEKFKSLKDKCCCCCKKKNEQSDPID